MTIGRPTRSPPPGSRPTTAAWRRGPAGLAGSVPDTMSTDPRDALRTPGSSETTRRSRARWDRSSKKEPERGTTQTIASVAWLKARNRGSAASERRAPATAASTSPPASPTSRASSTVTRTRPRSWAVARSQTALTSPAFDRQRTAPFLPRRPAPGKVATMPSEGGASPTRQTLARSDLRMRTSERRTNPHPVRPITPPRTRGISPGRRSTASGPIGSPPAPPSACATAPGGADPQRRGACCPQCN
jgi:hypothetical protein